MYSISIPCSTDVRKIDSSTMTISGTLRRLSAKRTSLFDAMLPPSYIWRWRDTTAIEEKDAHDNTWTVTTDETERRKT